MIPLLRDAWRRLWHDPLFAARWSRALLMALATGGLAFADQIGALLNGKGEAIKLAAIVAGFLSLIITAGEKNRPVAEVEQLVRDTPTQDGPLPIAGTVGAALDATKPTCP